MKKNATSVFTTLLNMFSLKGNGEARMVKLNSKNKSKSKKWLPYLFPGCYVKAYLYKNILEFEFYITSDNVAICIFNTIDNVFYNEVIDTVDTLHIIIKTNNWPSGIYTIIINNINDMSVHGNFSLEK